MPLDHFWWGSVFLVNIPIVTPHYGWAHPLVLGAFSAAAALLAAWERRHAQPMLPPGLFHDARFSAASLSLTLMFFATNGILFLPTQHLQFVLGYSPRGPGSGCYWSPR